MATTRPDYYKTCTRDELKSGSKSNTNKASGNATNSSSFDMQQAINFNSNKEFCPFSESDWKEIQAKLNAELKAKGKSEIELTGKPDKATAQAVYEFQVIHNLDKKDGKFGSVSQGILGWTPSAKADTPSAEGQGTEATKKANTGNQTQGKSDEEIKKTDDWKYLASIGEEAKTYEGFYDVASSVRNRVQQGIGGNS